ncbi:hypothetical protein AYO44_03205 [Planctomycetaceae bacterium SCGC AG-212-F19]|nr:hypothetical protein AYO44_03205 [Planctomycetaceae bacterium SCGC AG-212-F19]
MADPLAPSRPLLRKRVCRGLLWFGGWYLGVVIVLLLLENALLFQSVTATADWQAPPAGYNVEDVTVTTKDGSIHGWWFPKPGATGALLYCHGNAGNLSYRGPAIPPLMNALNVSVLIFDYPGYGKSSGKPTEAGCYAAADAMYDWLTETKHIPCERIILYGKSLGGGVATDLAVRRPHRALVLVKAFTSIPDIAQRLYWFAPVRWLVRNRFDNVEKLPHCSRPVAIAAADCDELMPLWMGQKLYESAPEPKRYFLMRGCYHNSALPPSFLNDLAGFLNETAPLPMAVAE